MMIKSNLVVDPAVVHLLVEHLVELLGWKSPGQVANIRQNTSWMLR